MNYANITTPTKKSMRRVKVATVIAVLVGAHITGVLLRPTYSLANYRTKMATMVLLGKSIAVSASESTTSAQIVTPLATMVPSPTPEQAAMKYHPESGKVY